MACIIYNILEYLWIFIEADVHTKESLGNAAATWVANMSAWTATAVAAKFYRSQSDTGRPQRPPLTGKAKPASLGMLENPNGVKYIFFRIHT